MREWTTQDADAHSRKNPEKEAYKYNHDLVAVKKLDRVSNKTGVP